MVLNLQSDTSEKIPLVLDSDGTARVGGTRVTLESVINAFELGSTAEAIAHKFPALQLDEVYAVLTYYLRHRNEVRAHLEKESGEADLLQAKIEARFPVDGIRERLLKRKKEQRDPKC